MCVASWWFVLVITVLRAHIGESQAQGLSGSHKTLFTKKQTKPKRSVEHAFKESLSSLGIEAQVTLCHLS